MLHFDVDVDVVVDVKSRAILLPEIKLFYRGIF